jgi:hypothetical protein
LDLCRELGADATSDEPDNAVMNERRTVSRSIGS